MVRVHRAPLCYSSTMALSDVVKEFEARFPQVERLVVDVEKRVADLEERAQKALDSLKTIEAQVTPQQQTQAQSPATAGAAAPAASVRT